MEHVEPQKINASDLGGFWGPFILNKIHDRAAAGSWL